MSFACPRPGRPAALVALLVVLLTVATAGPAAAGPPAAPPVLPTAGGWPLRGQVRVIKAFDPPEAPWGRGHRGVDLAAPVGAPVVAAAAGRVSYAGQLAGRGVVVVTHGAVRTTYEPVTAQVSVGAVVAAGQPLGTLSAGSHCGVTPCLHWGLRHGKAYLDPLLLTSSARPVAGEVRLLAASARAVAQRRAAARVAAAVLEAAAHAEADTTGPAGGHGFLHPVPGRVTSAFGRRFHPVLKVWKLHDGTDFGAPCGTPIRAPYAGVVTRVSTSHAYGHRLFLDHGRVDGRRVLTGYNHAGSYGVSIGDRVRRGQVIGRVGATGYATGCHLHLMVWLDGRLTNPGGWL